MEGETRYAQDRHKPRGDWVQTTMAESVVGVQHRKSAARAFANAARTAEAKGLRYGVQLQHEPDNPHDANAMAVYGVAERRGWLRRRLSKWHIGYLPRELAAELVEDLIRRDIPVRAELYSIYEGDDGYLDFKVIVLAPPGHGTKVRESERSAR